jgi:hypothetical protein
MFLLSTTIVDFKATNNYGKKKQVISSMGKSVIFRPVPLERLHL